jgi:lysozyme family protein
MIDIFDNFAPGLMAREGGGVFTNRAADKGGPTRWGMTAAALGEYRNLGRPATAAEVQALGRAEALAIYRAKYFTAPGFDKVAAVSARIAEELLDTGVNMGPAWPCIWLQQTLNVCNRQGQDWADIAVDGALGPTTVRTLQALLQRRGVRAGEDLVLTCLNGLQFGRYWSIATAGGPNNDQELNFVGWITARIGLAAA